MRKLEIAESDHNAVSNACNNFTIRWVSHMDIRYKCELYESKEGIKLFVPVYFLYIQTSIFVDFEHDRLTHRSEDGSMLGFPHLIGFTTCMVSIDFI